MNNTLEILERVQLWDRALGAIRGWFRNHGYIEVFTPARIAAPAPEPHIDCPRSGDCWLRASPELQMKKLVAAGAEKIFQIGPCFRAGERGRLHSEEFTMLEWYNAGATALDILAETELLVRSVARESCGSQILRHRGSECDVSAPWRVMTVEKAYEQWAGWNPLADFNQDRFDEDMALKIEPSIPRDVPLVLYGYPREAASLSRISDNDSRVAERWELYLCGIEVANAFGELTDGREQRRRFEIAREQRRIIGEDDYPLDEEFLQLLESGAFPECGGIALGIDRLAMLLAGADSIN